MRKATSLFLAMLMAATLAGFSGCKKAPAPGTVNAPAPAAAPSNAPSNAAAPSGGTNAPSK